MTANELADELTKMFRGEEYDRLIHEIPYMLRQQQAEIERLIGSKPITYGMLTFCKNCGEQNPYQSKTLTDEEIQDLWAEMNWSGHPELEFARAILRKAQEK